MTTTTIKSEGALQDTLQLNTLNHTDITNRDGTLAIYKVVQGSTTLNGKLIHLCRINGTMYYCTLAKGNTRAVHNVDSCIRVLPVSVLIEEQLPSRVRSDCTF